MITLVVVGTGTIAPSARTCASYWVEAGPVRLLMDCGAGSMHRAATSGVPWKTVTHVALTHFHIDHWGELPTLIFAHRHGRLPARTEPLTIIGPKGLHTRLTLLASAYGDWLLDPGFPVTVHEIAPGDGLELATGVSLGSHKTPHTPESMAYSIEYGGQRLVYTGDTAYSQALAQWAAGCDLLVSECSLPDGQGIDIHLTPTEAGAMAKIAHAKKLVLSHFYPQIEGTNPAAVAARAFGGEVIAASDGDRFSIGT